MKGFKKQLGAAMLANENEQESEQTATEKLKTG